MGGPNPASNSKLADLIAKAKRMSVPNDNSQRIIKKAEGGDKTEYEDVYKRQGSEYGYRFARQAAADVTGIVDYLAGDPVSYTHL